MGHSAIQTTMFLSVSYKVPDWCCHSEEPQCGPAAEKLLSPSHTIRSRLITIIFNQYQSWADSHHRGAVEAGHTLYTKTANLKLNFCRTGNQCSWWRTVIQINEPWYKLELNYSKVFKAVCIARSAYRCNSQSDSIRPSVTFRCFGQTNEDTTVRFSASIR